MFNPQLLISIYTDAALSLFILIIIKKTRKILKFFDIIGQRAAGRLQITDREQRTMQLKNLQDAKIIAWSISRFYFILYVNFEVRTAP